MDLKAQIPLAMVPIVIISITLGAAFSVSNVGSPVDDDESLLRTVDGLPVVFLGANPESNPILDRISQVTTNITRSNNLSVLDLDNSDYMLIIDGEWAMKGDQRGLIYAVRSLITAGVPIVIVNGDSHIISEAIKGDERIGFMTATTSNPMHSVGIHYDAMNHCGGSYDYSSVDGDLSLAGLHAYQWCGQFL